MKQQSTSIYFQDMFTKYQRKKALKLLETNRIIEVFLTDNPDYYCIYFLGEHSLKETYFTYMPYDILHPILKKKNRTDLIRVI